MISFALMGPLKYLQHRVEASELTKLNDYKILKRTLKSWIEIKMLLN